MIRTLLLLALAVPLPALCQGNGQPFDVWALQHLTRVSDPQVSPDGRRVAFVAEKTFFTDNTTQKHIYLVPSDGGEPRLLTLEGESNTRPRWSPDSRRIAFISDRSGSPQVWLMDADGRDIEQVTSLSTGAGGVLFAPDNRHLIFTSRIFPECGDDDACNEQKLNQAKREPVQVRVYDHLLYRHWDEWADGRRRHLFVVRIKGDAPTGESTPAWPEPIGEIGEINELTPGPHDVPPFSLGGPDGYAISPDAREVCFELNAEERSAVSTNADLYTVPLSGGEPARVTSNPAADVSPVYSPDGQWLAYRAQKRPGYESDRYRLVVLQRETGERTSLTETLDRWVTGIAWSPDSLRLFFTVADRGRQPVYTVRVTGGGVQIPVSGDASHSNVQLLPDGQSMVYAVESGSHPAEIVRAYASGEPPLQLTHFNDTQLDKFSLSRMEEVNYESTDGTKISGFLLKPPGFDVQQRYPLLTLIHGGPQGAWGESWSYRWNAQVFAAAGYVVFLPNPRGSAGYGQSFTDAVRRDWGGMPYEDIMAGIDSVMLRPYIDGNRLFAAGGSYGGYMVNWMLGHTQRFRALVSHAGVFDLRSMFFSTEELWFPLWEFGAPPWRDPEIYEKWSPSRFVEKFQTPTLVIHGQKDYRVPVTQGMQLFTALQMQKVPSKLLYYPDEGHWILKPQNRLHWYRSVLDWLAEWRDKAPARGSQVSRRETPPHAGAPAP